MGVAFKKGQAVRQIQPPPPEGVVEDISVRNEDVVYLLRYLDADKVEQHRWFTEEELEAV